MQKYFFVLVGIFLTTGALAAGQERICDYPINRLPNVYYRGEMEPLYYCETQCSGISSATAAKNCDCGLCQARNGDETANGITTTTHYVVRYTSCTCGSSPVLMTDGC